MSTPAGSTPCSIADAADVADDSRVRVIMAIAVTAANMCAQPRAKFYRHVDAANMDLKAFSQDFCQRVYARTLDAVLGTSAARTAISLEITTLLIPRHNDAAEETAALSAWIRNHLGVDAPAAS